MTRRITFASMALMACLAMSLAHAEQPGKKGNSSEKKSEPNKGKSEPNKGNSGPGKSPSNQQHGNSAPGGSWSEPTHNAGKSNNPPSGHPGAESKSNGPTSNNNPAHKNPNSNPSGAEGAAAANRNKPQDSGAKGAAAGATAVNRNEPKASGAEGAAAGAAAANRNTPPVSGAKGAAAGAAAVNRNEPKASGAEGAAAGAAAANRNTPPVSGAKGAAAGAAAVNRNEPKASGAEGVAAGAAAAHRNSPQVSGAEGAPIGSAAVRNSYNNPHLYDQHWYGAHPGVWAPSGWKAGTVWAPTTWATVSSYCGAGTTPVAYNYGNNVTCEDGNVTVDGQNLGTAAEFSQQAATLAQSGAAAEVENTDEWLPLGVFAMVRNEQQHPQLILQLAINKQGILRGNYTDELSEHTQPVQGAVDPKTQRAAWTVGDNKNSVIEAGLSNLSQDEAPVLIHRKGMTDHWLLVRLHQPGPGAKAAAGSDKSE